MNFLDEEKLITQLQGIEALFAKPRTEKEQIALSALEQIRIRLQELEKIDPPSEYRFTLLDPWSHRLMVALLRRYGVKPYRYRGQRLTTIMAKVSGRFVEEVLLPQFDQLQATLVSYFEAVTQRVGSAALCHDNSEAEER